MKVRYIGRQTMNYLVMNNYMDLIPQKIYEAKEEKQWYRIVDESGEDYIYPPGMFEIVEEDDEE